MSGQPSEGSSLSICRAAIDDVALWLGFKPGATPDYADFLVSERGRIFERARY